ncbi:DUF1572 family protein [Deinococcus sp.]|uniref:DUF1572 family protein n=1 Tax=Deinococcus sp. TaxID=47478 RepID=UPI0025F9BBE1|nr:DUF1572 family protein [Deinococcus sp.]
MSLGELYLNDVRNRMRGVRALGEAALAQLPEADWSTVLSVDGNSVAILIQHLSGNMHSRWGELQRGYREGLDGETKGRNRDTEFEDRTMSAVELMTVWNAGWTVFLGALDHAVPADLTRTLTIRGEAHTVLEAVQRQVAHYSGHVYQLIFLVRTLRGAGWHTLSIARGSSAAFNEKMRQR